MGQSRTTARVALLSLALVGTSCGGGGSGPVSPPSVAGSRASAASPSATSPDSPLPCQTAQTTITQKDFSFDPGAVTVGFCALIGITNTSIRTAHTFTIVGKGIDVVNEPGRSRQIHLLLPPGTYQFICRYHRSLGMKGTITILG